MINPAYSLPSPSPPNRTSAAPPEDKSTVGVGSGTAVAVGSGVGSGVGVNVGSGVGSSSGSVMLRLRRFVDSLSDQKLDAVLRFCARMGVNAALENVDEIDFQGRLLLKVVTKPAMFAALAYFLKLYLSANP